MADIKQNPENPEVSREKVIVKTSVIGILANVVLAAFKAVVGLISGSIAIVLDAVNNISDALSSVITIIGAKLAGKQPDKNHPMGYGRIEYMSQVIVAAIVLYAGITSLVESIKKIINPEAADYSAVTLIILVAGIAVKLLLGSYVQSKGREVNSGSLIASGQDATSDAILSASVLASAVIYMLSGISLEAFVGVVISVFIIKAGLEMIKDAVDEMLGMRADAELSKGVKKTVSEDPEVIGSYDLVLNNYGPDRYVASIHVEVRDTMTAREIDAMTRRLQKKVYTEHHIFLAAVGIYSRNMNGGLEEEVRARIVEIVMEHEGILQMHGFYMDQENKTIRFDIVMDFAVEDKKALYRQIVEEIQAEWPDYTPEITLDSDLSD
ncbi:MAG: cation diffusion facilitator family transporter [Lachnospiraceae bacterium]|nr:cation diffusion facilitator family transporter [Lachnospiraceae bacterium]